ncbi:MAG TPA: cold shock domain-containing protein [Longimicrobiaceae bacterium]|jgi:CspA family cold shock protein|nr:cold shock domain-containing protein [Longimicrobiaceae bacterium]
MRRTSGTVTWFDAERGHGFAKPEEPGPDVFLHHSGIHGSGLPVLGPGDRIEFDVVDTEIGPAAEGVVRAR